MKFIITREHLNRYMVTGREEYLLVFVIIPNVMEININILLKKNIIKKQNREINNKEIYSYMHDIFGRDVINLFDVKYEEEQKAKASEEAITVAPSSAPAPKKEKVQPTENFDA